MTQVAKTTVAAHPSPCTDGAGDPPDDSAIRRDRAARTPHASEIGAAMAHELSGPITALLLYIAEIQLSTDRMEDRSLTAVVDGACREAERIRELVLRMGDSFEATVTEDAAINAGRNAIAWWTRIARPQSVPKSEAGERSASDASFYGTKFLTLREQEVLRLVIRGLSNKEGAALMSISYRTFESHRARAMRKIGARNAAELVRLVMQNERADGSALQPALPLR